MVLGRVMSGLGVDIVLSTYNGEKYLDDLLGSIANQTNTSWRLLIRDDGSTDKTPQIVGSFIERFSQKVKIISGPAGRVGAKASFEYLLSQSDAEAVLFCDQDDIWHPQKISILLEKLRSHYEEQGVSRSVPVLIYSDLEVVDGEKKRLHESFWKTEQIVPGNESDIYSVFVKNFTPGCAMMINRSLAQLCTSIPSDALMHDWWVSMTAAHCGIVHHVPEKLVFYRIHGANTIGLSDEHPANRILRLARFLFSPRVILRVFKFNLKAIRQAQAFCTRSGLRFSIIRYVVRLAQISLAARK